MLSLIDIIYLYPSVFLEEEQFHEEREYLIKQVKALQRPVEPSPDVADTNLACDGL